MHYTMRSYLKKIIGPVFFVILVVVCSYAWNTCRDRAADPNAKKFSQGNQIPKTPQDYILLGQKIDINTASLDIIETLPHIGPVTAKSIVEYRRVHGKFRNVNDLTNVKGIGQKTLEKIRPYLLEIK